MSSPTPPSNPDVLDGWKSISDYLGKSIRTAQRWRQDFGMPVHRLGGREGENVYAFRSELDAWRREASRLSGFGAAVAEAADRNGVQEPAADSRPSGGRRRSRLALGIAAGILLLAAAGAWKFLEWSRPLRPAPAAGISDPQPARWVVAGSRFQSYNAAGEFLWAYDLQRPLNVGAYVGHNDPSSVPQAGVEPWLGVDVPMPLEYHGDLDGDGNIEILFVAHFRESLVESALYCFDHAGRKRWVFRAPDELSFGGTAFGAPRFMPWVTVSRDQYGAPSVWVAANNQVWYPTAVYRLNPSGNVLARYSSNGRITKLRFATFGGRQFALLGGVNNERKTAALAVFDVARFGGAAPAETAKYRCDACPPGGPDHYFLFPGTDLSRLLSGMPAVAELAIQPSREVVVSVHQLSALLPGEAAATSALTDYRLDSGFRVRGAEFLDQYVTVHDFYATLRRLDHRFSLEREEAQLWPVLRWTGSGYERISGPEPLR
jgi:hypothetical protein